MRGMSGKAGGGDPQAARRAGESRPLCRLQKACSARTAALRGLPEEEAAVQEAQRRRAQEFRPLHRLREACGAQAGRNCARALPEARRQNAGAQI